MTVLSFYQPGERFATMGANHVAKIWQVDADGFPVPAPPAGASSFLGDDDYTPDDGDGYRPPQHRWSRTVETTPPLPEPGYPEHLDYPVAPLSEEDNE